MKSEDNEKKVSKKTTVKKKTAPKKQQVSNQTATRTSATKKRSEATKKRLPKYKPLSWEEVFSSDQLAPLPTALPRLIEVTVSQTPDLLKGTVAQAVPVAYSILPRNLSFVYIDGREKELRMIVVLVAPEGGGKECVTLPVNHILAEVKARSEKDRQRLKEFNERFNRASDGEKPKRPDDLLIQWLYPDLTRPRLNMAMEDAGDAFLFLKMSEFEEWDKVEGKQGRSNSFSTLKLMFDENNDFGQDRVGAQSVNAGGCLRLNLLADTTEPKLIKYLRHVHGEGPISRITLGGIPATEIGSPIPVYGSYDKQYDESIQPFIDNLKKATGTIVCKPAQKMAEKLKAELDEFNSKTQNRILDTWGRRSLIMAFRRACLIYAANGMKWESEVIENYCRWCMQIDLYLKYKLFYDDAAEAIESVKMDKPGPQSLLDKVMVDDKGVFTLNEVVRVYAEGGKAPDVKRVRNVLSQWKQRGYILQMTNDSYKKVS